MKTYSAENYPVSVDATHDGENWQITAENHGNKINWSSYVLSIRHSFSPPAALETFLGGWPDNLRILEQLLTDIEQQAAADGYVAYDAGHDVTFLFGKIQAERGGRVFYPGKYTADTLPNEVADA